MKRNLCGSTPTSECTKVSNKCPKKMDQNTRMDQSESSRVASRNFETSSDACSGQQSAIPLPMVEEILMNLPAHQVVQVCRLVCHEWKELVDSAAHWRERCKREEIQPYDASRVPEDWRLFYLQSKYRRNLLKNPKADDGLQEWEFVHNTGDHWVTGEIGKPFPDNTVTKCFVASSVYQKEQLIDLKKEGYSDAFMDQLQPHIKISDWYTPDSKYSRYKLYVRLLDQERKAISTFNPYKVILHRNDYPWCQ
ncbi:F-box only protein 6-like, partial [Labeo rohita]|uniref:F-box only protein 6-like n=1 Tax=Labeo rohita TaxID=84645 RepID=UPI0021E31763